MSDPLLSPSLSVAGPAPYRLSSVFWVAVFGGSLAATWVMAEESRRLGRADGVKWIWGIGLVGAVVSAIAAAGFAWTYDLAHTTGADHAEGVRFARLIGRVIAVVVFVVQRRRLDDAMRAWELGGRDPSSLWVNGVFACAAGGFAQAALAAAAVVLALWWRG